MQPRRDSTLVLCRRLFAIARPYRLHIAGVMLLSLLSTPLALLAPLPLKIVVDSVVGGHPLPDWTSRVLPFDSAPGRALAAAVIVLLGVALLGELQGMATWVLQTYTTEQLLLRFRARLFAHVQRLSMAYHDTRGTSDSTYRIQYDAQAVQTLAVNGLVPFITCRPDARRHGRRHHAPRLAPGDRGPGHDADPLLAGARVDRTAPRAVGCRQDIRQFVDGGRAGGAGSAAGGEGVRSGAARGRTLRPPLDTRHVGADPTRPHAGGLRSLRSGSTTAVGMATALYRRNQARSIRRASASASCSWSWRTSPSS